MKRAVAAIFLLGLVAILLYVVGSMPRMGDPDTPTATNVVPRYLELGEEETGAENAVTSVIINYRGYDTMGEVTVIFCALALEAFINDYGISSFSRSFFDHYLDRLDAVSKWVIYPHLISGKPIRTGGQAFESLRRLFSLRNKLVHFKSTQKRACDLDESDRVSIEHASGAIQTVRMAVDELKKLDGQVKTRWVTEAQKIPRE